MIPQKLTVKNFMCYKDDVPPLRLENIRLACLSGDNGHGKTALLDAITWALWGQARARTQEELIHQGRQDMEVELEFTARDQLYRVSRKHSRSGRSRQGATILELQIFSENGYRPITGNTIRETEERIRGLVQLDYDTFINTAFLLQGQADMFTRSSPAKRKEALAEVLDLSYYQTLEERAKEKSKRVEDRIRDTEGTMSLRQEELVLKPDYVESQAEITTSLNALDSQLQHQRTTVNEARGVVDSLRVVHTELDTLTRHIESNGSEIVVLEAQLLDHQGKAAEYEDAIGNASEIRGAFSRLKDAKIELERQDEAALQASTLDKRRAALKQSIAVQAERISTQADQWNKRINQNLKPLAARIPELEEALGNTVRNQAPLKDMSRQLGQTQKTVQRITARITYLDEALTRLKAEMEETRRNFDILHFEQAECPVCKQPLGPKGRDHLRSEYEEQGRRAKESYQLQEAERRAETLRHEEVANQLAIQETELETKSQAFQADRIAKERDLMESRQAHSELDQASKELSSLEIILRNQDFAPGERAALSALEVETSTLNYDPQTHRLAQQEVKRLEPQIELHRKLVEALEALPRERKALEITLQSLTRRKEGALQDQSRQKKLQTELTSLPTLESDLVTAKSILAELESHKRDSEIRLGVIAEQLQRLAKLESDLEVMRRSLGTLVHSKAVYDELSVAFGRNGIQALVIETAIPQLQDDANELLGRLTEHKLSIKLQIQEGRRERRMGLPSEELEIKISDEVGTRSYETFSGGEAFRINFALRIALSKLLARRSGAPLPILFIDEGFGSQDYTGQERLKEAIQSIQSDFQKIIVITHVDQVKESFPTRIEVTKTAAGSTFVIV